MKKKLLLILFLIIFIILIIILVRKNQKITINLTNLTNQKIENEQVTLKVENAYLTDKYLILTYNLTSNNQELNFLKLSHNDNKLRLDRRIKINNHTITREFIYTTQIANIKSEKEATVYDIIDISDETIPEDFTIDIKFFENEFTSYYEDVMTEEEYLAYENADTSLPEDVETYEEVNGNIDQGKLQENAKPEDYAEVEGIYEWTNEISQIYENTLDSKEGKIIGEFNSNIRKSELQSNIKSIVYADQYEYNNLIVNNGKIIETDNFKIIVFNSQLNNINFDDLYTGKNNDPERYEIDILENGKILNIASTKETYITDINNTPEENLNKDSENITANIINYILVNNTELEEYTIKPYYYTKDETKEYIGEGF